VAHALARTKARAVSEEAMAQLLAYDFPGNVRELFHVIERAGMMCGSDVVDVHDLPQAVQEAGTREAREARAVEAFDALPLREAVAAFEKRLVERALSRAGGNRTEAARLLGIARPQIYAKMDEHGITRKDRGPAGEGA
jgi:DNA-binding NtrC family response regulator